MITIRRGTTPKSKERCPLNRIIIKREQFLLQVLVFGLLRFFILVLIQHILKGRHSYGMRLFHSEPAHSKPVAVDRLGFGVLDFTCNRYCGCHDLELLLVMMMVWSLRHIENWWLQIRKRDLDVHMVIKTTCKKLVHDSRFQIQIRERHKEWPYWKNIKNNSTVTGLKLWVSRLWSFYWSENNVKVHFSVIANCLLSYRCPYSRY